MDSNDVDTSGAATVLTAQEMLDRCIVPIKAEFIIRKAPFPKQDDASSTTAAAGGTPAEPSGGPAAGQKQGREQEQSKNKSRKQMRKDFRAGRQAELCTNYALGRCTYGEKCRFSHEVTEYVKSKPADLPGTCPWAAVQAVCPYGITCRYARTHRSIDELHRTLADVLVATAAAATEAGVAEAVMRGPATSAEPPCALPLPASIEKETNCLSKEVQTLLWKNRYDFSRSDAILKSMDLRISFKHQPKPMSGEGGVGGGGRGGGRGGGGRGRVGGRKGASAGSESVPVEGDHQVSEQQAGESQPNGAAAMPVTAAPPSEVRLEPPGDEAMDLDKAGVVAAAAAEAPDTDGPDDIDGPAAKRQRTDGGTDSAAAAVPPTADSAAIAALAAEQRQATTDGDAATDAAIGTAEDGPGGLTGRSSPSTTAAAAATAAVVLAARAAHVEAPLRPCERRRVDFRGKTYLAPLTTVGNLPFRRVCKGLGVDVTCGEMALATNLLQGQASEWALMKRHPCEDFFGVQVCGGYPDALARVGQLLGEQLTVDFVDINMGCPIDLVCDKSAGSALLRQPRRIEQILRAASTALGDTPLTFKTRKGYNDGDDVAHTFLHKAREWGAAAVTLHGRTRQQRYSRLADWDYIHRCGESCAAAGLQLIGNGDVFSYEDWNRHMEGAGGHLAALMVGRGALIKPWIFTEIKEQRHWDISATERLDLYKQFCAAGLEHWGSDGRGVETTRRFLLEWLSFTCRYVPVGLLEVVPQHMNHRPPAFRGRNELETLMASEDPQDWVRISEMLLGPPPAPISFAAKHKSNSYAAAAGPGAASELDMARG